MATFAQYLYRINVSCKLMLLFATIVIVACNNREQDNNQNNNGDSIRTEVVQVENKQIICINPLNQLTPIDSLFTFSRKDIPYKGKLDKKYRWQDYQGKHTFILSSTYDYNNGYGRAEIFAYEYLKRDSVWINFWRINDFIDGMGCDLLIDVLDVSLIDIDSNGTIETLLFYSQSNACDAGGLHTKLLLFENGNKIAVRGYSMQYLMPPAEIFCKVMGLPDNPDYRYENIDTGIYNSDTIFVKFALNFWNKYIEAENQAEIEANIKLRESKKMSKD